MNYAQASVNSLPLVLGVIFIFEIVLVRISIILYRYIKISINWFEILRKRKTYIPLKVKDELQKIS